MTTSEASFTIDDSFLNIVRNAEGPSDPDNYFVGEWFITSSLLSSVDFKFIMNADGTDDIQMKDDTNTYVSVLMPDSPHSYSKNKETTHAGYMYEATPDTSKCETMKIAGILKKKPDIQFGCLDRGVYYTKEMTAKYIADSLFSEIVKNGVHGIKDHINNPKKIPEVVSIDKLSINLLIEFLRYFFSTISSTVIIEGPRNVIVGKKYTPVSYWTNTLFSLATSTYLNTCALE